MKSSTLLQAPQEPVIVFSGAHQPVAASALRLQQVDALMVSFEYIRGNPQRFHETIEPTYDWPVRRYLDSGVYSVMRRVGESRHKIAKATVGGLTPKTAIARLATEYLTYLKKYKDCWHHVVELDVDRVLGPQATLNLRNLLLTVVPRDQLMPCWHLNSGEHAWEEMVDQHPFIAIGGDAGVKGSGGRQAHDMAMLHDMVMYAHSKGVMVHGMGDTRLSTFLATDWDSADSTTWISGNRFGRYGTISFSDKNSSAADHHTTTKARRFEAWLQESGIDPDEVKAAGTNISKYRVSVLQLQEREQIVRQKRKFGQVELPELDVFS